MTLQEEEKTLGDDGYEEDLDVDDGFMNLDSTNP